MAEVKYYYDDPLQAAWMTREFDINIGINDEGLDKLRYIEWQGVVNEVEGERFWVDPEDNYKFEPQERDLLTGRNGIAVMFCTEWRKYKGAQIITRDNKAFFMPKIIEEDNA